MDCARIEKLFWALQDAKLPDLRTRELSLAELIRLELIPSGSMAEVPADFAVVREAMRQDLPGEDDWRAANEALHEIASASLECHAVEGEIKRRFPGYSKAFYKRMVADCAFAMR